ncbi:MAG: methylated-DNA--[protein]-cysteine S-methyltransferase [Opitutaceae bacterium]|jgi:methylated-DNA-[protein]-cysteine S-methyltransferase|nr:methylated-DNA--[protein]-cysteine S-methyltransferase [Opitutaceae bacterium]
MKFCYDTFSIPLGDFSIAADEHGNIVATAFGDVHALQTRFRSGPTPTRDAARLRAAREQIEDYFAGRRRTFDLPLAPQGSPYQLRVWTVLGEIPFGETRSYGELARALNSSPRAIGRANGTNPIALIIPCHRVIGADGSLTGFAFGEDAKRRLLAHEGVEPWASDFLV